VPLYQSIQLVLIVPTAEPWPNGTRGNHSAKSGDEEQAVKHRQLVPRVDRILIGDGKANPSAVQFALKEMVH
jgi:hypothetical protein